MNIDNIYKNRPFLFEVENDLFEGENEVVSAIFKDAGFNDTIEYNFVESNYDYDLYKVRANGRLYCLKYSLDSDDNKLKKESEILKTLDNSISPTFVAYNKFKFGDIIHYLIMSFENFDNLKNFGIAPTLASKDFLFESYCKLDSCSYRAVNFSDYLNNFLQEVALKSIPDDSLSHIQDHTDLEKIRSIFCGVEKEILDLCSPKITRRKEFCHGNLKSSNILYCNGVFKFIDFSNSYVGNSYFDLADFALSIGASPQLERELFISFIDKKQKSFSNEEWFDYRMCYEISLRKMFLQSLSNYLKEVYVFASSRPMKILEIVHFFTDNNQQLMKVQTIKNNYEFIYSSFLEPILGEYSE